MNFDLKKSLDKELASDWENLFKSMGVSSMDELLKGKKDLTKLIPVKKQITRGGKTVETTVYVSPKEAEEMKRGKKPEEGKKPRTKKKDEPKEKKEKKEEPKKEKKKAKPKEEKPKEKPKSEFGIVAPHDDAGLKELHKQLDSWKNKEISEALKETSQDHYLVTATANGKVVGVGAFKRKGKALHMEHFGSVKEVAGVGKQLVRHLMEEAKSKGLGVSIKPPKASSKALQDMGFKDDYSGVLSLDSEEVKNVLKGKESNEATKNSIKEEPKGKSKEEEKADEHKKLNKELRKVRKQLGSDQYRALLEYHGIKWEKTDHQGVNTMRASMAAAEFVKKGGKLDVKAFHKSQEEAEKKAKEEAEKKAKEEEEAKKFEENKDHVKNANEATEKHDLDRDYFPVEFKEMRGKERLLVAGQVKNTTDMTSEDRKLIEELSEVRSMKEFDDLYAKAEDEGKLNNFTGTIFSMISNLYEVKSKLFKVDDYRVAIGRDEAGELGEEIDEGAEELSQEEENSILNYTGSQSTAINEYFRKYKAKGQENEGAEENAKYLDAVLNRSKLTKNVMLYRGAGYPALGGQMSKDILAGDFEKYIGSEITDNGYMSTSLGANSMFRGDVTFQIQASKGTKGRYLEDATATNGEHEVLLPRGTTLKVNKIAVYGSKIQILGEVIKQAKH